MNIAGHMVRGAAWMVGVRWCIRGLDLIATIILARLLSPDDFGVFATAVLAVGLLELLAQAGLDMALLRRAGIERADLDAAWTLQVLQGVAVAIVLFVAAPYIAALFDEPRTELVVRLLALRPLLLAFTNIGIVGFLKDLDFRKDFWFTFWKKFSGVAVMLLLAPLLRSYIVLVIGLLFGAAVALLLSYRLHPYRPRIALERIPQIWAFSGWMLVYYAAEDLVEKLDRFVLGAIASSGELGRYHVGSLLASAPTEALVVPLWRGLFPVYAKLTGKPRLLAASYLDTLGWTAAVCAAAGFGMLAVAPDAVAVLLGERWSAAAPLVQRLALVAAIAGLVDGALLVVSVTGHSRVCALQSLVRLATLGVALPWAGQSGGAEAIASAYLACVLCLAPIPFVMLIRVTPVTALDIIGRVWRPLLAGVLMLFAIGAIGRVEGAPAWSLLRAVLTGAAVYVTSSLVLWWLAGRPRGPERSSTRWLIARARRR